ncbi:MAG: hypothetical protein WC523_03895 [Patescibacteria group bacterium]
MFLDIYNDKKDKGKVITKRENNKEQCYWIDEFDNNIEVEILDEKTRHYIVKMFRKNWTLFQKFEYKNYLSHGIQMFYFNNGKIESEMIYKDGILTSCVWWNTDGKIESRFHNENCS